MLEITRWAGSIVGVPPPVIAMTSPLRRSALLTALGTLATLVALPVLATGGNFPGLTLSGSVPSGTSVAGRTAGSFALGNIARSDRAGLPCVGFADADPDHIIVLETAMPSLTLRVDSGRDTTLLVQGPDTATVRCGQDISRSNLDAEVSDRNWPAGTYRVWVGAHGQGQRFSYTLHATP